MKIILPIWLSEKIGAQKIKSYTDQEILESLSLVRGPLACATYTQMLKLACDAFSKDYFSEHYRVLEEADYTVISREDYVACAVFTIGVGTDQSLMPRKIGLCIFHADGLRPLTSQVVVSVVFRIVANNVVVAFDFIVSVVLVILLIQQFA